MFRRHIHSFVMRICLLGMAVFFYFKNPSRLDFTGGFRAAFSNWFLLLVWIVIVGGMLLRLVPNRRIPIGARKHYAPCFQAPAQTGAVPSPALHKGAFLSALAWILFNLAVCGALSFLDLLTPAAALVLVLIYSVCDLICILFFCPFQLLFMRNRCCTVCRIYNWDYPMMCTPLLLFPSIYSVSLLLLSLAVLVRWEISVYQHPHFFQEKTNSALRCANCTDRLCHLRGRFWDHPKRAAKKGLPK